MTKASILVAFACALAVTCTASTVPAFFWSNTEYFNGKSQLNSLTNFGEVKKSVSHKIANVELYVIIIDAQLGAEPFRVAPLKNLKNAVSGAVSSVTVPHAVGAMDAASLAAALELPATTLVTVVGSDVHAFPGAVRSLTLAELEKSLANGAAGFAELHNGVADVLVISLAANGLESHDELLGNLLEAVKDTDYVALYTASSTISADSVNKHARRVVSKQLVAAASVNYSGNDWWPDALIEAIVICGGMVIVLLIATCCTLSLQSVLKFDAEIKLRKQM